LSRSTPPSSRPSDSTSPDVAVISADDREPTVGHSWRMSYEQLWERLLEFLNSWATAHEVRPGQIEITLPRPGEPPRTVRLVMTRDEWSDLVTIPYGDFDLAVRSVQGSVLALDADQRFLVFRAYELVPSLTADLPEGPEDLHLQELARQHPDGFGRWVVLDEEGNILEELGPPAG
jgi:hypothetical protein